MNWKKIGINLIYPHIAVIICLLPISITLLVVSLVYLSSTSIISIILYVLAFYVLLVICFRIPRIIKLCKNFKQENKYIQRWILDVNLRINVSLYGTLIWNIAFALFQFVLGVYYKSFWFYAMFLYYIILGMMRFFLLKHTRRYKTNEKADVEIKKYILCGYLLLIMNLALAVIVFFIVYLSKTFEHNMITTIAIATYTFTTFTFAIINTIRYKKYNSPVYSASKNISLIGACVSMLTLETTMLTTFGTGNSTIFKQVILSLTGAAVIGFALSLAVTMLIKGNKQLNIMKEKNTL